MNIFISAEIAQGAEDFIASVIAQLGALGSSNVVRSETDTAVSLIVSSTKDQKTEPEEEAKVEGVEKPEPKAEIVSDPEKEPLQPEQEAEEAEEEKVPFKKCTIVSLSSLIKIESFSSKNESTLLVRDVTVDAPTDTIRFKYGEFSFTLPVERSSNETVINKDHVLTEATIRVTCVFDGSDQTVSFLVNVANQVEDESETLLIGKDLMIKLNSSNATTQ